MNDTRTATPTRLSPVHDTLAHLGPRWGDYRGMPIAAVCGDTAGEVALAGNLALCDVSALSRITVKGWGAAELLMSLGVSVPSKVLHTAPLQGGGLVVRTGAAEFFVEDGPEDTVTARVQAALGDGRAGCYPMVRQDASFLLSGWRASDVFRETCAYDFRKPVETLVMTRVAGVSSSILSRTMNQINAFQLWLDPSFGDYLWTALIEIVRDGRGDAIGAAVFFPELIRTVNDYVPFQPVRELP